MGIINYLKKFKYFYVGQLTEGIILDFHSGSRTYEITYNLLANGFGKRTLHIIHESQSIKSYTEITMTYRRAVYPWLKGASIHPSWFNYLSNTIVPEHNVNINGSSSGEYYNPAELVAEPKPEAEIIQHPHLTLIQGDKNEDNDDSDEAPER